MKNLRMPYAIQMLSLLFFVLVSFLPDNAMGMKCAPKEGEPNWIKYDQIFVGTVTGIAPYDLKDPHHPEFSNGTPQTALTVKIDVLYKGTYANQVTVFSLPSDVLMGWQTGKQYLFTTHVRQGNSIILHCSDTQAAEEAKPWIEKLQKGLAKVFPDPVRCEKSSDCHVVTFHVPPQGAKPGKTKIRCQAKETPLSSGQSLQSYQEHISKACVCENNLCITRQ